MRRLLLLLICACVAALGNAQSLNEYLRLRKANKIVLPTAITALDNIVDARTLELSTTVKGTFKVDTRGALMIDKADGSTAIVDCVDVPEWLVGNEVKARLLVKAYRDESTMEVKIDLLGAAPEADVAVHDKKPAEPKAKAPANRSIRKPLTSRNLTYRMRTNEGLPESVYTPIYAGYIGKINRRLTADESYAIAHYLIGYSLKYGVDARLIMAMVLAESSFNPFATSRSGAQGLGQLMPGTASGLGVGNAYDVEQNLNGMIRMVRGLLDKYRASTGDDWKTLSYTLAAYNAGPGAVSKHGGIPPYRETQNYVDKVVYYYSRFTAGDKN
jgi:hypothetical protein